jgi:hypothetical protein
MGEFYRWRALRVAPAVRAAKCCHRDSIFLSALLIKQIPVLAKLM